MNEYETKILIDELQKLVVKKAEENGVLSFKIERLEYEVKRLEDLLRRKTTAEQTNK